MKRLSASFTPVLLGLVCAVFFVSGCALFEQQANDSLIKFSAASSLQTKVHYGDIDNSGATPAIQMIWDNGDVIRIVSDNARTASNADFYDYPLVHDREEGAHSFAKFVQSENQSGLRWEDGGSYNFYAAYPAVNVASDGTFSASLPSDEYLMVAHTSTGYDPAKKVFLSFYPAFTAVEITLLNNDGNVIINDCALSSSSTALVGDFTATIGSSRLSNINIRRGVFYADPVSGLTESLSNGGKRFTFFCLPQNLYNLELTCYYTKNGAACHKTIALKESGSNLMFEACKYHRLSLTVNSSGGGGGDIDLDLTVGGAQMLLYVISNHEGGWPSPIMSYCAEKYGISDPIAYLNSTGWDQGTPFYKDYFGKWSAIIGKVGSFITANGWNKANERFKSNSTVFPSASGHFTEDELTEIVGFLETVTNTGVVGNGGTMITGDIIASDFDWLPSLVSIDCLQADQNLNPRPSVEVVDRPIVQNINLNYYTYITIESCGGSEGVTLTLNNSNNVTGELIVRDLRINGQINIGNQHAYGPVLIESVSGMTSLSLGDGTDTWIKDCPDLETITVTTSHNLTDFTVENCPEFRYFSISNVDYNKFKSICLEKTPMFTSGDVNGGLAGISISLQDCSTGSGSGVIRMNNMYFSNDNINITRVANADNAVVRDATGAQR